MLKLTTDRSYYWQGAVTVIVPQNRRTSETELVYIAFLPAQLDTLAEKQ